MTPQNRKPQKEEKAADDVIRLEDLAPRGDIKAEPSFASVNRQRKSRAVAPWEADFQGGNPADQRLAVSRVSARAAPALRGINSESAFSHARTTWR